MKVKTNIKSGGIWNNLFSTSEKEENEGAVQPEPTSLTLHVPAWIKEFNRLNQWVD